jgi:alpha-tubulin suppressor-like RCC1 family protein
MYGQLGRDDLENIGDKKPPAGYADVDVGAPVVDLALGDASTCALLEGARVRCWGWGEHGQLGRQVENKQTRGAPARMPDVKLFDP